jgi:hypothetical protein
VGEKPYLLKKKGIAGLARPFLQPLSWPYETPALPLSYTAKSLTFLMKVEVILRSLTDLVKTGDLSPAYRLANIARLAS